MIFAAKITSAQLSVSALYKPTVFTDNYYLPAKKIAPPPSMMLQPAVYNCNWGFFCRQEVKVEHAIGIPFKFRLGSVQYVDYLEGKRGTGFLNR